MVSSSTILLLCVSSVCGQYYPTHRPSSSSYRSSTGAYHSKLSSSPGTEDSHHHPHSQIDISPYKPWSFPFKRVQDSKFAGHPGYQTNIVIDPYAKDDRVVEITTEDLYTGLQVGNTKWSGPGTLTLSALTAILDPKYDPDNEYELIDVSQHQPKPHQHRPHHQHPRPGLQPAAAVLYQPHLQPHLQPLHPLLQQHQPHLQPAYAPHPSLKVLGKGCRGQLDCSPALKAICGYNNYCQGRNGCHKYICQCPKGHIGVTNQAYGGHRSRLSKRSLRYYQECKKL